MSGPAPSSWDVVIRPARGWLDLGLRDLWRYRDLIRLFVRRDVVAQYKQTILGPAWMVLQPVLTAVVFALIFGGMAGLSTNGLPRLLFYLSGQVVWGYFASVLTVTSDTFIANAHIFGKVYFPRLVMPVSVLLSQLIQFGLRLAVLAGFMVWYACRGAVFAPTATLIWLPLALLVMMGLALGLGILFSAMTSKYRDLRFLLAFGVQLLMFTTTAVLPLAAMPSDRHRLFVLANPMTPVIECFRQALLGAGDFHPAHLLHSGAVAVVAILLGLLFFTRVEREFMDTV
jgi:lipopolysaccharide transport system permease protein